MRPTLFIINPKSGNASRKITRLLQSFAQSHPVSMEFVETRHSGHATEIARHSKKECIVAVGGDGTVNEVINGLIGSKKTLGVVPTGSGNDFIKAIGMENSVEAALKSLTSGATLSIDIGSVEVTLPNSSSKNIYFGNGIGAGFDASVAVKASKIKYITGTLRYALAVMNTLGTYSAPEFTVRVDSRVFQGKYLLIAVGNGPCAGGGFYLTPDAKPNDGLLDVCTIKDLSVPGILHVMPKVMMGKHGSHSAVHFDLGAELSISADEPFAVHADGEILGQDVLAVKVGIVRNGINVAVPAASTGI